MHVHPSFKNDWAGSGIETYPPEAAACKHVLPWLSGVLMSKPAGAVGSFVGDGVILYN